MATDKSTSEGNVRAKPATTKMQCRFMKITPAVAQTWLGMNFSRNRALRRSTVGMLVNDIKAGKWVITHQAIAFNSKGKLIDGQHRLAAIAAAGRMCEALVCFNTPDDAVHVIDLQARRSLKDTLYIAHNVKATNREVACAMMIAKRGVAAGGMSQQQRKEIFFEHANLVSEISGFFSTNLPGVCRGSVMAVIARAYAVTPQRQRADIKRFCKILVDGYPSDGTMTQRDRLVVQLRDLLQTKVAGGGGGGSPDVVAYRKTERALHAYLQNKPLSRIDEAATELFPLPNEVREQAAAAA